MIVIVCGGRDYTDQDHLFKYLIKFHAKHSIDKLIEGGASGADTLARRWAELCHIPFTEIKADWKRHGPRAGPLRNEKMADMLPDAVIAFPGGRGTANMKMIANRRRIKVFDGSKSWT